MEKDLEKAEIELARLEESHMAPIQTARRITLMRPPPPPPPTPPKDEGYRPVTSSTKRLSLSTTATTTTSPRRIKYGTGKHSKTELSPQPTDDPDDPLNWPQWKKELNFVALMMTVGLIGGMKTAYVSVNGVLAARFDASYTAVASLTAVPLVVSAFTGLLGLVAAKVWGKRPVYLVSMVSVFIGAVWNMRAGDSFGECMGARVFQGLGWGAFDTLVLGSIQDTYFEHERNVRITAYNVLSVATTWGAPLLGGVASRNAADFTVQFEVINAFQIVAVPLLVFGAPETSFERWFSFSMAPTPTSAVSWMSRHPKALGRPSVEGAKAYLRTMKPVSFSVAPDLGTLLQAPRAFVAPTTLLLVVVTFLPHCALWGLAGSLSLLFSRVPWTLSESAIGSLMAAPFTFAVLGVGGIGFYRKRTAADHTTYDTVSILAAGTALAAAGILAFGLETHAVMSASGASGRGPRLSFPLLSFLLGLLAAGVAVLDGAVRPVIWRSTQFTSSNMGVCLRNVGDMHAGVACWRNLLAGVFVMVLPNAVVVWSGLKSTVVGLGVTQILVGAGMCGAWWFSDDYRTNLARVGSPMEPDERIELVQRRRGELWEDQLNEAHRSGKLYEWVSGFHPDRTPCRLASQDLCYGSYNAGLEILFDDGTKWLLRLPRVGKVHDEYAGEKVATEVAIIHLVRRETKIPVPEIKGWGIAAQNPLELGPFMIMDYIQGGVSLDKLLNDPDSGTRLLRKDLSDEEMETIYRQFAGFLLQLFKLDFDHIGAPESPNPNLHFPTRPLTWKAHDILHTGGVNTFGDRSKGFSSTTEYFDHVVGQDCEQLVQQPNSAYGEYHAMAQYRSFQALKTLVPSFVHEAYDKAHFKIICDDLGLANLIVRSREDLTVIGLVDLEWSYIGPAQLFGSVPSWLLMDRRTNQAWDCDQGEPTHITSRYFRYLDLFKRVMEEEEAKAAGHGGRELSKLIHWSEQSGAMWAHMLLSAGFNETSTFPFTKLIEFVGPEEWERRRSEVDEKEVAAFGARKKLQLEEYSRDLERIEAESVLVDTGQKRKKDFVRQVRHVSI
ncbi:putative MFS-type transporter [Colletotrichum tanaceti]|uniref:Putative MFS-type transporter n=1 Tax=Colletotrichum tanaceti TaxID=1306861 RepID=A0A4U6XH97_9PEZI|nr:putative MFS-type transporter [Colletotrichum tanaceti]TKW53417.1 putative MFS-type transporter [Colletotrichum tanaceti]